MTNTEKSNSGSTTPVIETASDPFDVQALRRSQDYAAAVGVKKTLKVKVRKPSNEWWFQTHPSGEYYIEGCVVDLKEEREIYWVAPALWPELNDESTFSRRALFTCMTRQGDCFLWPIRLPWEDGRLDDWNQSALDYARQVGIWQRVTSNTHIGAYDQYLPEAKWDAPNWPEESLKELLQIGFKRLVIESLDHPAIKRLKGRQ